MPQRSVAELRHWRARLIHRLDHPTQHDDVDALLHEAELCSQQLEAAEKRATLLTHPSSRDAASTPQETTVSLRSAVQTFADSEQVAGFRANGYTGRVGVEFPSIETRALIDTGATSGGAFQNPQRPADIYLTNLDRAPRIADLLDRRSTDQNAVEWVQDTTATATVAAETPEGALKPEASYTFAVVTDPVRTVAHWVPITRQALDDSPALQAHVEGRLAYGLDNRIDSQLLNGTGTAPQLRGILNTPGIGAYVAAASEAAIISVRKAMTVAQTSETSPDAVVMHPVDWERIELSTDSAGLFRVSPSVASALAPRIWGLTVVPTTAITGTVGGATPVGGRFLVGAFRMGAILWERSAALFVTDSHASNFTSNVLTLLAQRRLALSVVAPKSFVAGTFSVGTA